MERRTFFKHSAAALVAGSAGITLTTTTKGQAMDAAKTNDTTHPIERRTLGRTGEKLSIIGFGGIIVMNQTPEEAREYVAAAIDQSINYFDVAPSYGNAEERLGPALAPFRKQVFLACKTAQRGGDEAEKELHNTLKVMQTDHVDLYQLHAIEKVSEDVERIFQPGGVMDRLVKAREAGKIRFLGFSAHSEEAVHAALERFDFDTILFPFNFNTWSRGNFGPGVFEIVRKRNMGLLALKAMARRKWPETLKPEERKWQKAWYEPLDQEADIELALRYTLGLPVTAALPPGHWELFNTATKLAASGRLAKPLSEPERDKLMALASGPPVFSKAA